MGADTDSDEYAEALWATLGARAPDDVDRAAQALGVSVFAVLDLCDAGVLDYNAPESLDSPANLRAARAELERAARHVAAQAERPTTLPRQLFLGPRPAPESFIVPTGERNGMKPAGGLWTSSYDTRIGSEFLELVRRGDAPRRWIAMHGWLLDPPPVRVLSICSRAEVEGVYGRYRDASETGAARYRALDWPSLARDYDAVHLAAGAARRADVGDDLYGWDCECTWWCRWPHGARISAAALYSNSDAHTATSGDTASTRGLERPGEEQRRRQPDGAELNHLNNSPPPENSRQ